ncbi:MAG: hypothetical protein NTU91_14290 [Chloroflexi bacterium]|nr:hypothetical protein [Chloroflexota bacterium]
MEWVFLIIVAVLLLGPLRHWAGRHWALLVSIAVGAGFGFVFGSILSSRFGVTPLAPLIGAIACAIDAVAFLPCQLRRLSRDGRDREDDERRH